MKKAILFFSIIGLIAVAAILQPFIANASVTKNTKFLLVIEKYNACIIMTPIFRTDD
jgi:hypothetical protein